MYAASEHNADQRTILSLRGVTKVFGDFTAVEDVNLDIAENEFFALLGPSGCGKTTLLRMLAGFEMPNAGTIHLDGKDMSLQPPNRRPVNMVFQSYAVFPHMSVRENVAYGLKVAGVGRSEARDRVEEALQLVKLDNQADKQPDQLSGGQRQRVALARALIKRPRVLLLDEPLSALDAKLREAMQMELVRLRHALGITFIIVTHDQDEALSMADRVAVMNDGQVQQVAAPLTLYEYPTRRFVADFIGKMNLFSGRLESRHEDRLDVRVAGLGPMTAPTQDSSIFEGREEVDLAVRPEKVRVTAEAPEGESRVRRQGTVKNVAYYGDMSYVFVTLDGAFTINANVQNEARRNDPALRPGDRVWCSWEAHDMLVLAD
ncbi:MAG: ABC transporter ATP-binding protein [Pseudomonadota bacterium]|uniref:ABC transporter ATP-binding protein n=1 Tax=Fodinicurvata fenggangensis TaxID=1121830 RepID=UPI00047E86E6|nr:ABC transporter ATP-binding protein [Fodinicurvata fenggangensis]